MTAKLVVASELGKLMPTAEKKYAVTLTEAQRSESDVPAGVRTEMDDNQTTATTFFESYSAAFERADVASIVDHFAFPCHITSEATEVTLTPIASPDGGLRMVEQLLGMYRVVGVSSARVLDLAASEVSPRLVQALVHWALYDDAGELLYAFEAAYILARIDGSLRVSAIAHNEIPRYRECLARITSRPANHPPG